MSAPKRIQRKRTKGWKMPENAVYVGRPTKWGNPIRIVQTDHGYFDLVRDNVGQIDFNTTARSAHRNATERFRNIVLKHPHLAQSAELIRAELAGKDLVCWCPLNLDCHADVLLEIANREMS